VLSLGEPLVSEEFDVEQATRKVVDLLLRRMSFETEQRTRRHCMKHFAHVLSRT